MGDAVDRASCGVNTGTTNHAEATADIVTGDYSGSSTMNNPLPRHPPTIPGHAATPLPQFFATPNGIPYYNPQQYMTHAPGNGNAWPTASLPMNSGPVPYGTHYPFQPPTSVVSKYGTASAPPLRTAELQILPAGVQPEYIRGSGRAGLHIPKHTSSGLSDPPPSKRRKLPGGRTDPLTTGDSTESHAAVADRKGASDAFWSDQFAVATKSKSRIPTEKRMITPITTDVPADIANTPIHELIEEITDAEAAKTEYICDPSDFEAYASTGVGLANEVAAVRPWPRFKCKICKHAFPKRQTVLTHLKSHMGMKPYLCSSPGCKMSFVREHDCKRHEGTHTGYRGYSCECGKQFTRQDALRRHASYHRCNLANVVQYPANAETESVAGSPVTPTDESGVSAPSETSVAPLSVVPTVVARPVGRPRKKQTTRQPRSKKEPVPQLGESMQSTTSVAPMEMDDAGLDGDPVVVVSPTSETIALPEDQPKREDEVAAYGPLDIPTTSRITGSDAQTLKTVIKRGPGRPRKAVTKRGAAKGSRAKVVPLSSVAPLPTQEGTGEPKVGDVKKVEEDIGVESSFHYDVDGGHNANSHKPAPVPNLRSGTPTLPGSHPAPRRSPSPIVQYTSSETSAMVLTGVEGSMSSNPLSLIRPVTSRQPFLVERLLAGPTDSLQGAFALRPATLNNTKYSMSVTVADMLGIGANPAVAMSGDVDSWSDDDKVPANDDHAVGSALLGSSLKTRFLSPPIIEAQSPFKSGVLGSTTPATTIASTFLRQISASIPTCTQGLSSTVVSPLLSDMSLETVTSSSNMSPSSTPTPPSPPHQHSEALFS
ncbi:hypothetical protein FRB95_006252 [Tulasnella sp. JGI-2019a]|nr:hypothetical protein FRB95_006252 [Tulasnella sp. JGI-2019a]